MDKMLETEPKTGRVINDTAYYKAEIAETFAKIRRIAEETNKSQAETERLRRETRIMLDQIKAELNVS